MDDNEAFFGIGEDFFRLESSAALAGAVTGVNVHVERPEAVGTMVSRGISERCDLAAAMGADEAVVVFGKSFCFHNVPLS